MKDRWYLKPDVLIVVAVWLALLPFRDEISLVLGYPLRLAATEIAVGTLRLFGSPVTNEATTIYTGTSEIAITDACSGVEELLALFLAGYLISRRGQKNLGWTLFAWLFTLPAVIVANVLRLVAVILLEGAYGETVLTGTWHTAFGYAQAIMAIALVYLCGKLVRKLS